MITIGVDSSTTNCGVAVFKDGDFVLCQNFKFKGTYDDMKLYDIVVKFAEYFGHYKPELVIIEEPINVRNRRGAMALSQTAGAIYAVAVVSGAHVNMLHNQTVKKQLGVKTKKETILKMKSTCKIVRDITEHEADAIALVLAYMGILSD